MSEMSFNSGRDEGEGVATLLATALDHRQHCLHKSAAARALRSKRQLSPYHRMTQRTLTRIVRRLDPFMPQTSKRILSFLGLGVQPPTATWGNMMEQAQSFISQGAWWMWVFPSLFIVFTILCINLLGDGLRDALDPHASRHM